MKDAIVKPDMPLKLLLYDVLQRRKELTSAEASHYNIFSKGFVGECVFEGILREEKLMNILPLYSLLLNSRESECQIDALLLTKQTIYLIEVKHFGGDYLMQDGKFIYLRTKKEMKHPLAQSERTTFLFKKVLEIIGIKMAVQNYVVFTNSEFMLYNAPVDLPFIFPGQIRQFLHRINANAEPITDEHEKIATILSSQHKEQSRYERRPAYTMEELDMGMFCWKCNGEFKRKNRQHVICDVCQSTIHIKTALLNSVAEFQFLFPDEKITVKRIFEWCGGMFSWKYIRRALGKHLTRVPKGKHTYFFYSDKTEYLELLKSTLREKTLKESGEN